MELIPLPRVDAEHALGSREHALLLLLKENYCILVGLNSQPI